MLGAMLGLVLAAPWSEPVRSAIEDACTFVYAEEERPAVFCACVVREVQGSVTEAEIIEFATLETTPVDAKVGAALRRAESTCKAEMRRVLDV